MAGIHGEPDDELGVGLIAPQADVLDREIDGERLCHLILHTFEQRHLVAVAGGLLVEPVQVRRQVAERTGRSQAETVSGAQIECAGGIGGRGISGAGPGESDARAAAAHVVARDGGGPGTYAVVAAHQISELRGDGDIQFVAVVDHAGGRKGGPVAEMTGAVIGERIEAGAELGAAPPRVMALRREMDCHGQREGAVQGERAAPLDFHRAGLRDQRVDMDALAQRDRRRALAVRVTKME